MRNGICPKCGEATVYLVADDNIDLYVCTTCRFTETYWPADAMPEVIADGHHVVPGQAE